MTYQWNEEKLRFMEEAGDYTGFNTALAEWMAPYLTPEDTLTELGCGTGHLSMALSPLVKAITAVDISAPALDVLRRGLKRRGLTNVRALCADAFSTKEELACEVLVSCFFGLPEELFPLADRLRPREMFFFKRAYAYHRFSAERFPVGDDSCERTVSLLKERGVPCAFEIKELEMGQPLRSLEEARRFLLLYALDPDKSRFTDEYVQSRLVETGRGDYPLYMPQKKTVGCIHVSGKDWK